MGFLTFSIPEPHLGQAHHGFSAPGGTEFASMVQVHETAVTETLRVVGTWSSIHLWGQPLRHQLSSGGGGGRGGFLPRPRVGEEKP